MSDLPADVVEALAAIPGRGHLTGEARVWAVDVVGRAYSVHGASIRTIAHLTQGRSYGSVWTLLAESQVARRGPGRRKVAA